MARGRMINQTIAEDIEFNEMSIEAQLMFVRTIPFLDRDGLINGHPAILVGKVAPLLLDMFARMPAIIEEWLAGGLVSRYMDGKVAVLFFKGFTQNQIGMRYEREPESQFAPPPGLTRTSTGLQKEESAALLPPQPAAEVPPAAEDKKNDIAHECGELPEDCRQSAGSLPEDIPLNRIKENINITTAPPSAVVDNGSVFTLWQNNMPGSLTQIVADELQDLIDTYGALEVDTAIRLAVKASKRNVRYVRGILVKRAAGDEPRAREAPPLGTMVPAGISGELGFSLTSI